MALNQVKNLQVMACLFTDIYMSRPLALFDQPLILEGKRKRKSVEMFSFSPQDEKSIQSYEVMNIN